MNRAEYLNLVDTVGTRGAASHLIWASGAQAGRREPWASELPGEPARGLGGACRETADGCVFAERLVGAPRLVVVGAGHVGQAFVRIAATLGFHITVIDQRQGLLDEVAGADHLICAPYAEALGRVPDYANTYYVLVTPGHESDRECAALALAKPYAYVGMIGSKRKVASVLAALRADGLGEEKLADLHAPIGIPLGGREPAEIAVSIAAEIIRVRSARADATFDPEVAAALRASSEPAVMATIVGHGGSVPRGTGSRMLVGASGRLAGSVGGGRVEAEAIDRAVALLSEPPDTALIDYDLSNREGAELGMICGGRVRILFERL